MEGIKKIIQKRTRTKNKNIHSEVHYWADVISSAFHERKRFAMYLGIIRRIGVKAAQQIFTEIKQSNVKSPGKLFVWKAGKTQTVSSPARGGRRRVERAQTPGVRRGGSDSTRNK